MSPYAIFMDIDNTIVGPSQYPSKRTVDTIAKYRAQGHRFFIASGRPLFSATEMADRIGPDLDIICSNGTISRVDEKLDVQHLTPRALEGIYRVAHDYQLPQYFFTQSQVLYLRPMTKGISEDSQVRIAGEDPNHYVAIDSVEQLKRWADRIINAIAFDQDPANLAKARVAMAQVQDIDTSSSSADNIEITGHGINKASAILRVCERLNQPMARTMAFGDGSNDLEMLTTVHYGVAMGNANAEVKAATKFHTLDIDHDGVAAFLDDFFGGKA